MTLHLFLCESQAFLLANSTFVSINFAQLPSCSYDRACGLRPFSTFLKNTQRVPFFSRSVAKRSSTRDNRNFFTASLPMFSNLDSTGIDDTPCRGSPFALNVGEVISCLLRMITTNVLATATEFFCFFGSSSSLFQDGFVCVAEFEVLVEHSCELPSREKAFFLCSFFFSSTFLLTSPLIFSRPQRFVCNFPSVMVFDAFRSAIDFANSIS